MLGPYLFSSTSRETLGDKIELYFHDHSFMPLFIQVLFFTAGFLFVLLITCGVGKLFEDPAIQDQERTGPRESSEAIESYDESSLVNIRRRFG